jgi:hypothetical protein
MSIRLHKCQCGNTELDTNNDTGSGIHWVNCPKCGKRGKLASSNRRAEKVWNEEHTNE